MTPDSQQINGVKKMSRSALYLLGAPRLERDGVLVPLDGLGAIARLQGNFQQAAQLHRESLTLCQEFEERRGIALCLNNLGLLAYDMQDYPAAEQHLRESLTRYKEIGHRYGVAFALCNLGYVLCASGRDRHEEARGRFHQALEIALKIDARPVTLNALVGLATLLCSGSPEQAEPNCWPWLYTIPPASRRQKREPGGYWINWRPNCRLNPWPHGRSGVRPEN